MSGVGTEAVDARFERAVMEDRAVVEIIGMHGGVRYAVVGLTCLS